MSLQYKAAKYAAGKAKEGAKKAGKFVSKNQKGIMQIAGVGLAGYLIYKFMKSRELSLTDSSITDIQAITETGVQQTLSQTTIENISYETASRYSSELQAKIAEYNKAIEDFSSQESQIVYLNGEIKRIEEEIKLAESGYNDRLALRDSYSSTVTLERAQYLAAESILANAQSAKLRAEQAIAENNRLKAVYQAEIVELRDILVRTSASQYFKKWSAKLQAFGPIFNPAAALIIIHNNEVLIDGLISKASSLNQTLMSANSTYSTALSNKNAEYNQFKAAESKYDGYVNSAAEYYRSFIAPLILEKTANEQRKSTYQIAFDAFRTKINEMKVYLQFQGVSV